MPAVTDEPRRSPAGLSGRVASGIAFVSTPSRSSTTANGWARSSPVSRSTPYEETATIALVGSIALARRAARRRRAPHPLDPRQGAPARLPHDRGRRRLERPRSRPPLRPGRTYDELTQLAATLDAMLERLSASLRHEQRFTAELSHELRTPLAQDLRRERTRAAPRAHGGRLPREPRGRPRNAEQMTRTVEALIAAARQEAGPTAVTRDARDGVELPSRNRGRGRSGRDRRRVSQPRARALRRVRSAREDRASAARQRAPLRPRRGLT